MFFWCQKNSDFIETHNWKYEKVEPIKLLFSFFFSPSTVFQSLTPKLISLLMTKLWLFWQEYFYHCLQQNKMVSFSLEVWCVFQVAYSTKLQINYYIYSVRHCFNVFTMTSYKLLLLVTTIYPRFTFLLTTRGSKLLLILIPIFCFYKLQKVTISVTASYSCSHLIYWKSCMIFIYLFCGAICIVR